MHLLIDVLFAPLLVCINEGDNDHTVNVFSFSSARIRFRSFDLSECTAVDPDTDMPFVTFHQESKIKDMSFSSI